MTVSTGDTRYNYVDHPQDKVTLGGNSGVGKTTLFMRFKTGQFVEDADLIINAEGEFNKNWLVDEEDVSVTLYDTAGIEKYMNDRVRLNSTYFRWSKVVVFVYDITKRDSFDALTRWEEEAIASNPEPPVAFLVGNKLDLEDKREVTRARALQLAENYHIPKEFVLEVSAKTGVGVNEMFESIARQMVATDTKTIIRKMPVNNKSACSC